MVLLTIISGGVPVRVKSPPVLDPKATGIKSLDGRVPILQAELIVTGIKVATVPVLLTTPESNPEPNVVINSSFVVLLPASFMNFCPANAVQPVCDRPSPIMNKAAIIITVGLLNPLKVSCKVRIPKKKRLSIEIRATISGVNFPQMKRRIVIERIASIRVITFGLMDLTQ